MFIKHSLVANCIERRARSFFGNTDDMARGRKNHRLNTGHSGGFIDISRPHNITFENRRPLGLQTGCRRQVDYGITPGKTRNQASVLTT